MNKEFITEFIEEYRRHPALWKIKSSEYLNRNLKNLGYTALMEVCKKFNITHTGEVVQKKIQSLRSTFRKEYKKVENSTRSGCGSEDVYTPNLWYFDMMMFIKDQEQPSQSVSNVASPSTGNFDEEEVDDDDDTQGNNSQITESEGLNESQVASPSPSTSQTITPSFITKERQLRKRQRKGDTNEHNSFLKACTDALTSSNVSDDSDAFGIFVGKKLKSVKDASQKMYAETLIMQVLQRAVMSNLSEATVLTDQPRLPTLPQYFGTYTDL